MSLVATNATRANEEPAERRLTVRAVVLGGGVLQAAVLLAVAAGRVGVELPFVRPALAVGLLSFVPGLLVLSLLGMRDQPPVSLALYAVGTSFVVVMAVGVATSLLYPVVGVARPISETWVTGTVAAVNAGLGGAVVRRVDREAVVATLRLPRLTAVDLLFLTLPSAGILAIAALNRFGTTVPAIGFVVVVSVVPALTLTKRVDPEVYGLAVWACALSLLFFKSLWEGSYPLEMWMHQMVLQQGRWVPTLGGDVAALPDIRGMGVEGVLTDAVLYPVYALVAGIGTMTQLEVVNPLFVSLIPVGMYETFRRYVDRRDAMLAAFVFAFAFRFYAQNYPNGARDVMATLFLILLGLAIADRDISRTVRRTLAPVFVVGIGVSHYGAAYIVLASLFLSVVLMAGFDVVRWRPRLEQLDIRALAAGGSGTVVTYSFVLLAAVFVLTWYLFTAGGIKFQILSEALARLLEPVAVSGLASERVLSEKPFSVEVTRNMTIAVFGLVGVGALLEGVRRILRMRSVVGDQHLSITVGLTAVFGFSFLSVGTGFGKGRVLAISLSFASVLAVLALHDVRSVTAFLADRYDALPPLGGIVTSVFTESRVRAAWAVFLCVFLLFNTGVVAETVTGSPDYGASTVINDERLANSENPQLRLQSASCIQCDVAAQVWTLRYGADGSRVYDGGFAGSYYWYGHSVVSGVDGFVPNYLLANRSTLHRDDLPSAWSSVENGSYVLFTSANYRSDIVLTADGNASSLADARTHLDRSNKIYTMGRSAVYRFENTSRTNESAAEPVVGPRPEAIDREPPGGHP